MNRIITCLIVFLTISTTYAQKGKEKQIIKAVDQKNEYYKNLLLESVNINSGTMNFEGVKKVGMQLKPEFEKLGMQVNWLPGDSWNRAGHLVAETKGSKGPKMLLIGHLDTVFEPESPFQEYKFINDSIVKAPGIADMKGGNIIILAALNALNEIGVLGDMQIKVVLTGDEEKSGSPIELSKKALTDGAEWADIALAFENADGDPRTIVVARRGSLSWTLEVEGNAAHSSQVFSEKVGTGAIYESSRILNEFYKQLSTKENLTFNPGVILGGTDVSYEPSSNSGTSFGKTNVVSQKTIVHGDLRAISSEQVEKAKKTMYEIVSNNYPGTSATLKFDEGGYPPLSPTDGNYKLLSYYNEVSKDLVFGEVKAVNPRNAGAADVSFTAGLVDMAIDGMGLSGADDHTINETGDISKLPVQTKRAAVLMYRLMKME